MQGFSSSVKINSTLKVPNNWDLNSWNRTKLVPFLQFPYLEELSHKSASTPSYSKAA